MLPDDFYSRKEMAAEVDRCASWKEITTGKRVSLKRYFRDDETKQLDIIFLVEGDALCGHADYKAFQERFAPETQH